MKVELDDGNIILYHGNCSEILPQLKTNSIEVCVTSPPYNLHLAGSEVSKSDTAQAWNKKYENWYHDTMPEWEYQGWQQSVVHELVRICKSSVFYNHKIRYAWNARNKMRNPTNVYHPMDWLNKFPIWCEIIWDRCGIGHPCGRYHNQTEKIYQIGRPRKWDNSKGLTNIWKIPPSKNEGHVCTFPKKLVDNCILPTTDEKDWIIDPFLGSGTTALVAIQRNRRFVGIEKNKEFFDRCLENIKQELERRESSLFYFS